MGIDIDARLQVVEEGPHSTENKIHAMLVGHIASRAEGIKSLRRISQFSSP